MRAPGGAAQGARGVPRGSRVLGASACGAPSRCARSPARWVPRHTEREIERIAREAYRNFGRMTFEYARFPRLTRRDIDATVRVTGGEHLSGGPGGREGRHSRRGALRQLGARGDAGHDGLPRVVPRGRAAQHARGRPHEQAQAGLRCRDDPAHGEPEGCLPRASGRTASWRCSPTRTPGSGASSWTSSGGPRRRPTGRPGSLSPPARPSSPAWPSATRAGATSSSSHRRSRRRPRARRPTRPRGVLTQAYTRVFEDFIRRHPDHYFWMHRRWKTRPDGSREPRG